MKWLILGFVDSWRDGHSLQLHLRPRRLHGQVLGLCPRGARYAAVHRLLKNADDGLEQVAVGYEDFRGEVGEGEPLLC